MKTFETIFRYALAVAIVVGFFWLLGNLGGMKIDPAMRDTFIMVIGVLVGKFGTIVDYEWGTSKSSADKNKMITPKE